MRYLRNPGVREGLISGTLACLGAIVIRLVLARPNGVAHYEDLSRLTGLDFGQWPQIFYAGANGDGEIFAVLAADPGGSGPAQLILEPVYRFMRIGYSLAAWVLSGGNSRFVLPALFVVGLVSVMAVGFYAGFLRDRLGPKSWFLMLNPALYFGFAGDTAEPLGILLLVVALGSSSLWASIALGIVRPSYAPALWGRWKLLLGLVAAALVARVVAVGIFGGPIGETADGAFGPPVVAYFSEPSIAGFAVLGAAMTTVALGLRMRDGSWILSGVLLLVLGAVVVDHPVNAIRAAGMLPVLWAFAPQRLGEDSLVTASAPGQRR